MKRIICFCILCLSVLLFDKVYASNKLSAGTLEMECVYENGIVMNAYYAGDVYGISFSDIKLSTQIQTPGANGLSVVYNEAKVAKQILETATCPTQIYYGVVRQWNADGSASVSFSVYTTVDYYNKLICGKNGGGVEISYDSNGIEVGKDCVGANSNFDRSFFKKKVVAGFEPDKGYLDSFVADSGTALNDRCISTISSECNAFKFNLVNESVYFVGEVQPIGQWAFKSEGEQAAGKAIYAKLYRYHLPNGQARFFIEHKDRISMVENIYQQPNAQKETYLCLNAVAKEIDTGKNATGFNFTSIRHSVTGSPTADMPTCPDGYTLYKSVDWNEAEEAGNQGTDICEVIPNTALVLADIINWARIIVPALLIIYTGIDISRIVIAGNIDEELPKRRKNIIIRFVVALFFFFLPLFVQVIVASTYGIDFGDISCLWT